MKKIKVLFISIYDPLKEASGPGNHLRYLTEALCDKGCEIHVLLSGSEMKTVTTNGVTLHYFKSPFFSSSGFVFSIFCIRKINEIINKYGIDIIHGQSPSSFGYALLSRKKIPFIVTAHSSSFGEIFSFTNTPLSNITLRIMRDLLFVQPLTTLLTKIEYGFADKTIAVSANLADEIKCFYHIPEKKIVVIHNGIILPHRKQINTENVNHTILFVGRLIWRKGVKHLIDALPSITSKYPDTKLIIVGNGEQEESLKKLVCTHKIQDSVKFMGKISNETLLNLYLKIDVYVQPSIYEPLGIAIMEAMSNGKSVIASNVGGIPELITNWKDGVLVKPANSSEIGEAILTLFSNSALKENLGGQALKKMKMFTWKKIAEKTSGLYQTLLDEYKK